MSLELKTLIEDSNKLIETLRAEAKGDVARIEAQLAAQLSEKAALEQRLVQMENTAARATGLNVKAERQDEEVKSAFIEYLRSPTDISKKQNFEQKALTTSGLSGAIPRMISADIIAASRNASPIASLSTHVQTTTKDFQQIISNGTTWTLNGETGARAESNTSFETKTPFWTEVNSVVKLSNHTIEDVGFDVMGHLSAQFTADYAEAMSQYFMTGTGAGVQPQGLVNGGVGVTGGAAVTADGVIDLSYAVNAADRAVGSYIMSSATAAALAKTKASGQFIMDIRDGVTMISGKPVYISDFMPATAPVMFGNWKKAFLTATRAEGISVLVNPYKTVGEVEISGRLRFGSVILHNSAYAKLNITAG